MTSPPPRTSRPAVRIAVRLALWIGSAVLTLVTAAVATYIALEAPGLLTLPVLLLVLAALVAAAFVVVARVGGPRHQSLNERLATYLLNYRAPRRRRRR